MEVWIFLLVLSGVLVCTVAFRKLTTAGALLAGVQAGLMFGGLGTGGAALLAAFFLMGTVATRWGSKTKSALHLTEPKKARNAGQVLANGGVAAAAGLAAMVFSQQQQLWYTIAAGALSAAAADTCSSELGVLYGKRFYNIRNFRPDHRGLDGVVSVEGTGIGIVASLMIALVYWLMNGSLQNVALIIVAGTLGNIADSLLGATLERKGVLKNDAVNMLNTFVGAAAAGLWYNA